MNQFIVFIVRYVIKHQIRFEIVVHDDSKMLSFDIAFFLRFENHVLYTKDTRSCVRFACNIYFIF